MVHDIAYSAIGFVYLAVFCNAVTHVEAARLRDRLASIPNEHYCHLALAILYPMSLLPSA